MVVDAARPEEGLDEALVVGPVGERRRRAGRRPTPPQLRAVAGVAGVAPAPERRVGRQRHDRRQPRPNPVDDGDGQFGVVDPDVDMAAADHLLPGQLLVLPFQPLVLGVDVGVLGPGRERVGAGRRQPAAAGGQGGGQPRPESDQGGPHLSERLAHRGVGLQLGRVQLRVHVLTEAVPGGGEEGRAVGPEGTAVGIDEEELLLDADGERTRPHGSPLPRRVIRVAWRP